MSVKPPRSRPEDHKWSAIDAGQSEAVEQAASIFRAMGDAPRLRTLQLLLHGERCVTELVVAMKEKISTVSQRLRLLRGERLVTRRREGTHVFYGLADAHVAALIRAGVAHAAELTGSERQSRLDRQVKPLGENP